MIDYTKLETASLRKRKQMLQDEINAIERVLHQRGEPSASAALSSAKEVRHGNSQEDSPQDRFGG
jgi:hypothetical protein